MMLTSGSLRSRVFGWTLTELLVAMAIMSSLTAGLAVGAITMQKSFLASRYHVDAQAQQMRLMDYMNLDLRRALTVTTSASELTLTIPDYYQIKPGGTPEPREPKISRGNVSYGSTPRTIRYFQQGSTIFRSDNGEQTALATNVLDFKLSFQDLGQSIIMASVTFLPKFQFNSANRESVRDGTATFSTTLLRNKRP